MQIQPVGLIGATLTVQLCLLVLIFLTNRVLPQRGLIMLRSRCDRAALVLSLITVACIVVSEELYTFSAPVFGDLAFPKGLPRSWTYLILFLADLFVVFQLIQTTGGSKTSPFTVILFLLPTIAIFLREPPGRFLLYAVVAAALYILGLMLSRPHDTFIDILRGESGGPQMDYSILRTDTPAHAIVNLGCLAIATLTGYITRPVPVITP